MTTRIEVSASAFAELTNALRVHGVGVRNGVLDMGAFEVIKGEQPDHFNKFELSIINLISSIYGTSLDRVKRETRLHGDSLDLVEMVMAIEDEFEIQIRDEDITISTFDTVQDVLAFAEKHKCRTS